MFTTHSFIRSFGIITLGLALVLTPALGFAQTKKAAASGEASIQQSTDSREELMRKLHVALKALAEERAANQQATEASDGLAATATPAPKYQVTFKEPAKVKPAPVRITFEGAQLVPAPAKPISIQARPIQQKPITNQHPIVINAKPVVSECTIETRVYSPQGGSEWMAQGLDTSRHPEILSYHIRWFNGNWSREFFPGKNDIDVKKNGPHRFTDIDDGQRRRWSYFQDHQYAVTACAGAFKPAAPSREITYVRAPQSQLVDRTPTNTRPVVRPKPQPTKPVTIKPVTPVVKPVVRPGGDHADCDINDITIRVHNDFGTTIDVSNADSDTDFWSEPLYRFEISNDSGCDVIANDARFIYGSRGGHLYFDTLVLTEGKEIISDSPMSDLLRGRHVFLDFADFVIDDKDEAMFTVYGTDWNQSTIDMMAAMGAPGVVRLGLPQSTGTFDFDWPSGKTFDLGVAKTLWGNVMHLR